MNEYTQFWPLGVYTALWFFVFGLCLGSFLNVVALRGLSGESIVLPPSKCSKCGNKLKWWMNIPVLSYISLRGKCYFCKTPISPQYPVVELFTGLLSLLTFLKFGLSVETLFFISAGALLIIMSVCDLKESVILDYHAYLLIAAGLLYRLIYGDILFGISGAVCGFILYEAIARLGYPFAGQRAFGEGDSLIAAGIGAFFGWKLMLVSAGISVLIMAAFTFPYLFIHACRAGKKQTVRGLIGALLLIVLAFLAAKLEFVETFLGSILFLAFIIAGIIRCIYGILSGIRKNRPQSFCTLPFGPAMAISFFLIMFFEMQIKVYILSHFAWIL